MSDIEGRMAELRAAFVIRARVNHEALIAAEARGDREEIRLIAHNLAGKGGLFGFPEITEAARHIEDAIDEDAPSEALGACCERLYGELRKLD